MWPPQIPSLPASPDILYFYSVPALSSLTLPCIQGCGVQLPSQGTGAPEGHLLLLGTLVPRQCLSQSWSPVHAS